jgi:hypothetical protein
MDRLVMQMHELPSMWQLSLRTSSLRCACDRHEVDAVTVALAIR